MKKLISLVLMAITFVTLTFTSPAFAGDAAKGKAIFTNNCAACHIGGKNLVNAKKTLKTADLNANNMNSLEAIVNQVTNGKGAMPKFSGRLKAAQIEDVATYVLEQAKKDWK